MTTEKLAIAPVLKGLKVGESVCYPMERYASVQNTLTRVRRELTDCKFTTTYKSGELEVTRLQ